MKPAPTDTPALTPALPRSFHLALRRHGVLPSRFAFAANVATQRMALFEKNGHAKDYSYRKTFRISTSRFGISQVQDSNGTPLGLHRIARKIGGGYPIFVPFSYWRLHPLRIGLDIRYGGYWDPLGYWSVNDYSPYDGYGYNSRYNDVYTSGQIRGVVESVDFRRGTLVINDDISRQFVTVTMPRDRRVDSIRPGDLVDFSGDWSRRGVFNAYRLERVEEGRY